MAIDPIRLEPTQSGMHGSCQEAVELRRILIETGRALGCGLSDTVSTEFLACLPTEARWRRRNVFSETNVQRETQAFGTNRDPAIDEAFDFIEQYGIGGKGPPTTKRWKKIRCHNCGDTMRYWLETSLKIDAGVRQRMYQCTSCAAIRWIAASKTRRFAHAARDV